MADQSKVRLAIIAKNKQTLNLHVRLGWKERFTVEKKVSLTPFLPVTSQQSTLRTMSLPGFYMSSSSILNIALGSMLHIEYQRPFNGKIVIGEQRGKNKRFSVHRTKKTESFIEVFIFW